MNPAPAKFDFLRAAREDLLREGFQPDFPPQVLAETNACRAAPIPNAPAKDLRDLLWSSIDNPDSRDLDQVEWAERLPDKSIRVLVGIADVDAVVTGASATDAHARANATSVYPGGPVFPMLPERLSTDLTSLGLDADRRALVMEFNVSPDGSLSRGDVYPAALRNRARLNYDQVAAWLQDPSRMPATPAGLREQLLLQQEAAQHLKALWMEHGALTLGGVESEPLISNNLVQGFATIRDNAARDIIENFMVAANVAMAQFLRARNSLCLRRVVRTPKHWDRIQDIARELGTHLPDAPDSKALGDFLTGRKQSDPLRFPELSLAVLKSLGPGEYAVEHPGEEREGHFGLAVEDYTHSTAPNRRYADLVMQRLLKASVQKAAAPYSETELIDLAAHCTDREKAARHVERFMKKVAAALLLAPSIGTTYDAIVTGVTPTSTYARLLTVPAEGRVNRGARGLVVGQKTRVRLTGVNPAKGFIDFETVT
jgi:exoribonuclease-2